jgi:2-C-methyl-D-erythritol 2,4-cyclodiphosphate synthase
LTNLDCVVSAENIRVLPHREAIRTSLARRLGAPPEAISVKGKTGEGLDAVGEGRAVEALVVCLLEREEGDHGKG